jgi:hypothetical protein
LKRVPFTAALAAAMIFPAAFAAGCSSAAESSAAVADSVGPPGTTSVIDGAARAAGSQQPSAPGQQPVDPASKPEPASALPDSVWIEPAQIPLEAVYTWQPPSAHAYGTAAPQFEFEQLCQTTKPSSVAALSKVFKSATATLTAGVGATAMAAAGASSAGGAGWLAQEVVTHDPSLDSASDQVAYAAFADLTKELQSCAQAVAGAQVTVSTNGAMDFAATVTIPTATGATATLHDYLIVPDGTIVELALWVVPNAGAQPVAPWSNMPDASVFSALKSPVCGTYHDC